MNTTIIYIYIGLDPAFPLYVFSSPSTRLSATDAKFVDVIHTDGGVLGFPWPLGHADFFPNGGIPLQPGCAKQELLKNRWFNVIGELKIKEKNLLITKKNRIYCIRSVNRLVKNNNSAKLKKKNKTIICKSFF